MTSLQDIQKVRLDKIELLKKAGMDPYPARVLRDLSIKEARLKFSELGITLPEQISDKQFTVAGRVMAIRGQGAILFAVLDDGSGRDASNHAPALNISDSSQTQTQVQVGRLQIVIKKDVMTTDLFDLFSSAVDVGDFISVTGKLYVTKRGEASILADKWVMATKSLSPLPDKWHGLQDEDARFRKRYLDFIMNPSLRDLFAKKSQFWQITRRELISAGFLEVETPTLEVTTGGAEATPFKTHHNDFDLDVYMRISVGELWQKRLMAGGFDRTFEIGRVYRNEGSSPDHLQEFTNLEFYASWMDYKEGIKFTEDLIKKIAKEVFGTYQFSTRGHSFNLEGEWKVIEYVDTVKDMTGVDVLSATAEEMKATLDKLHVKYEGDSKERLTDTLWKYCRKRISGPAWLIHHPKLVSPLSKSVAGRPELTERVQLILAGAEVTNGFSELNDPIDQRARFEEQQELIKRGDSEAMMPEWDFVEMLETGMPPTFGFAYGDRLFAFLADKTGREIQVFPLMKPLHEGADSAGGITGSGASSKKDKNTKIAVLVINEGLDLKEWEKLNTATHLGASLGAHVGGSLLMQSKILSKDGDSINLNIKHAIMLKKSNNSNELFDLAKTVKIAGLEVEEFTREMISTTNDKKVAEQTLLKNSEEIERLGILVFGAKDVVEKMTEKFERV